MYETARYRDAFNDLTWGEHGHTQNKMVRNYFWWLDNVKGLGALNTWCEELIEKEGVQEDAHAHIITAIVAARLS